ncbi:MAG TPA: hypothetical protein VIJ68_03450 [Candidatus Saccharimonadales bacterium]
MHSQHFDRPLRPGEGQPYREPQVGIRAIDPLNEEDIRRLRLIDRDPVRIWEFEGDNPYEPLTDGELRDFATPNDRKLFFAVVGSAEHPGLPTTEVDQVQGWFKLIPDSPGRVNQLRSHGIITPQTDEDIWKISCAKLKDAPRGQMASAMRQVCMQFAGMSDEALPTVVAYITPTNQASINMTLAAGFVKQEAMVEYEAGHPPNSVYVLDWARLQEITQRPPLPEPSGEQAVL